MLAITSLLVAMAIASPGTAAPTPAPRFELHLTADEYAVVHGAISSGIKRYGGGAEFRLTVDRDSRSGELSWTFAATNPRLVEVMRLWMCETTAELVGVVDFDRIDDGSRIGLRAAQSVNAKIRQSLANPIYDPLMLSGTLEAADGGLVLRLEDGDLAVASTTIDLGAASIRELLGKPVVATGVVKVPGQLDVSRIIDRQADTLEMYVMSGCPFAKMAEQRMIAAIRHDSEASAPVKLDIRYVFVRDVDEAGNVTYGSLHGEPEVVEDLVQMTIRDSHPELLLAYLELRATSDSSWHEIAAAVGLLPMEIAAIEDRIQMDRHGMIEREYARMVSRYGEVRASPTFVWEGIPVAQLADIPLFRAIDLGGARCGGEAQ